MNNAKTHWYLMCVAVVACAQPALADDVLDVCGMSIEGIDFAMSKDDVDQALSSAGYTKITDSDEMTKKSKQKSKKLSTKSMPNSSPSLAFISTGGEPNDDFIQLVGWAGFTTYARTTSIRAKYALPKDPGKQQAYYDFVRATLTEFCEAVLPTWRANAPQTTPSRFAARAESPLPASGPIGYCENVVQGNYSDTEMMGTINQRAVYSYTTTDGCTLVYNSGPDRRFPVHMLKSIIKKE